MQVRSRMVLSSRASLCAGQWLRRIKTHLPCGFCNDKYAFSVWLLGWCGCRAQHTCARVETCWCLGEVVLLTDVLCVPGMTTNLLSLAGLEHYGLAVKFAGEWCEILLEGRRVHALFSGLHKPKRAQQDTFLTSHGRESHIGPVI